MPPKINLLPEIGPEDTSLTIGIKRSIKYLQLLAAVFISTLVIAYISQFFLARLLSNINLKAQKVQSVLPQSQSSTANTLSLTKTRLQFLNQLKNTINHRSSHLKNLFDQRPKQIQLESINWENSTVFEIKGFSPDHFNINHYFKNLESLGFHELKISSVNLNPKTNKIFFRITGQAEKEEPKKKK